MCASLHWLNKSQIFDGWSLAGSICEGRLTSYLRMRHQKYPSTQQVQRHACVIALQVQDVAPVLSTTVPLDPDGAAMLPEWQSHASADGHDGSSPSASDAQQQDAGAQGASATATCGDAPLAFVSKQLRHLVGLSGGASSAWPPSLAVVELEHGRSRFCSQAGVAPGVNDPAATAATPGDATSNAASSSSGQGGAGGAGMAPPPKQVDPPNGMPGAAPEGRSAHLPPSGGSKTLTRAMILANAPPGCNLGTLPRLDLGLEGLGSVQGLDVICPALQSLTLNANHLTSLVGVQGLTQLQVRLERSTLKKMT